MKAKTELLLYQLLWIGDQVAHPTFGNLSASFETWTYNKALRQTINRLEHQEFLETHGKSLDQVIHLTEKGRKIFTTDLDPETEWAREWDGMWRMVLFDIPESKSSLRQRLRRILRENRFGCLQRSVWLSPHPMNSISDLIRKAIPGLASLSLMECRLLRGQSNAEVVKATWDYSRINANYDAYVQHLSQCRAKRIPEDADRFIAEEKRLWEIALKHDPLLPKQLVPSGYIGKKAWRLRKRRLPMVMAPLPKYNKGS